MCILRENNFEDHNNYINKMQKFVNARPECEWKISKHTEHTLCVRTDNTILFN